MDSTTLETSLLSLPNEMQALIYVKGTLNSFGELSCTHPHLLAIAKKALHMIGVHNFAEARASSPAFQQMLSALKRVKLCPISTNAWMDLSLQDVHNILNWIKKTSVKDPNNFLYQRLRAAYLFALPNLQSEGTLPECFLQDPIFVQIAQQFPHSAEKASLVPTQNILTAEQLNAICSMIRGQIKYEDLPGSLRIDPVIAKIALAKRPLNLQHALGLRNSPEIVCLATAGDLSAFQFASEELRGNEAFAAPFIQQKPHLLEWVSAELKDKETFVRLAIEKALEYIQYASERLRGDKAFFLSFREIMKANPFSTIRSLEFLNEELKHDPELDLRALLG